MSTNASTPTRRRFRGSPLDQALGAILALVCIVVPPFLYGQVGVIYALIVLNGLLIFGLRETITAERAPTANEELGWTCADSEVHCFVFGKPTDEQKVITPGALP